MAVKPRKGGGELFYLNEHGNKQDAALHEEIFRAAPAVSLRRGGGGVSLKAQGGWKR